MTRTRRRKWRTSPRRILRLSEVTQLGRLVDITLTFLFSPLLQISLVSRTFVPRWPRDKNQRSTLCILHLVCGLRHRSFAPDAVTIDCACYIPKKKKVSFAILFCFPLLGIGRVDGATDLHISFSSLVFKLLAVASGVDWCMFCAVPLQYDTVLNLP